MNEEEFKVYVSSLRNEKLEEPKNLSSQADVYWKEITLNTHDFDRSIYFITSLFNLFS